jgi:hypothetical protein
MSPEANSTRSGPLPPENDPAAGETRGDQRSGRRYASADAASRAHATALLPAYRAQPRVIVCERGGAWAVALRRELGEAAPGVHQTNSLADCWDALAAAPASLLVVELTARGAASLLDRIGRLPREFPLARVVVVADRRLRAYQWLMREAGAVHFTCSPRRMAAVARLARRHMAQIPQPPQDAVERIWAGLPWGSR